MRPDFRTPIPFKKPYDRLVQGKGGQVTIYWTPKDAGRKCAEVLAGRRDPYQARLLCGSSVWSVRWLTLWMRRRPGGPLVSAASSSPTPVHFEANLYAYAANSPVTKVDPSGLWTWFARRLYKQIDAAGIAAAAASWAVCAPLKGKVAGFICAMAMYLLFAEEGVPYLQIDLFYQRSAAMTIAVPVKKAFGRWVVGTGGLLMIYWTPRNAGMKCAEVLAGIRGPYGASLLCGNRVTKVRW